MKPEQVTATCVFCRIDVPVSDGDPDNQGTPCPRCRERAYVVGRESYSGDILPRWVQAGARVRVKATPVLRKYGLDLYGSPHHVWPGEFGTVRRVNGRGWWSWQVDFQHGSKSLDMRLLEDLARVKEEKTDAKRVEA